MWRAKLQRMMDELPEKYLQVDPESPNELMPLPPGSKPAGPLTDEEIRLDGVCRQLWEAAILEGEAHRALHGQDFRKHPPEACLKHNQGMVLREQEIQLVSGILLRSLGERLGFENGYAIKGHDVYTVPPVLDDGPEIFGPGGRPVIMH